MYVKREGIAHANYTAAADIFLQIADSLPESKQRIQSLLFLEDIPLLPSPEMNLDLLPLSFSFVCQLWPLPTAELIQYPHRRGDHSHPRRQEQGNLLVFYLRFSSLRVYRSSGEMQQRGRLAGSEVPKQNKTGSLGDMSTAQETAGARSGRAGGWGGAYQYSTSGLGTTDLARAEGVARTRVLGIREAALYWYSDC